MFGQLHLINAQIEMRSGCKIFSYLVVCANHVQLQYVCRDTSKNLVTQEEHCELCTFSQPAWTAGMITGTRNSQRVRCFYLTLERYSFHEEEAKSATFFDLMTGIK